MKRLLLLVVVWVCLGAAGVYVPPGVCAQQETAVNLSFADRMELKRFLDAGWRSATIKAGHKTYSLTRRGAPNVVIDFTIEEIGSDYVTDGQISEEQLRTMTQAAASAGGAGALATISVGGVVQPLKAWRYEIVSTPGQPQRVERVEYNMQDLGQVQGEEVATYIRLYEANPPKINQEKGEAPRPASDYAFWYLFYSQLQLWEKYVQQVLQRKTESKIPTNPAELEGAYPNLANEYETERQTAITAELKFLLDMYDRLKQRRDQRNRYAEYRGDRLEEVRRFSEEWVKRINGDTVTIEGTTFIRSNKALEFVPSGAVNVVSPWLSPFDLLDDDGSVKKPEALKKAQKKQ